MTGQPYGSLGGLTDRQLQQAADRFGLGRVLRAWPLTEGLFGKNVALDTTSGGWVLRGDPWPANSDEQFRREAFFARQIHDGCSIPAPWPYHVATDPGTMPWPYSIMRRLDGHGVDLAHRRLDWTMLAEALGRGLAELHSIHWPRPGQWQTDADGMVAFGDSASEWLEARVAAWMFQTAATSEPLDLHSEKLLLSHLELARSELDGGTDTTYVHHDYKPENLSLARTAAGRIEVVGVFDLNEGYAADPLEDIPRTLSALARGRTPEVGAAFLRAYRAASGRELSAPRIIAYTLFDLLVIWEFGRRRAQAWFAPDATFNAWAHESLDAVEQAINLV